MSSTRQGLKETRSQVSQCRPMLKAHFTNSCKYSSLPWILVMCHTVRMGLNKPTGCGRLLLFIHVDVEICEKVSADFDFPYNCDLQWRSRSVIKTGIKMSSQTVSCIISSMKEISLQILKCKAMFKYVFCSWCFFCFVLLLLLFFFKLA